MSHNKLETLEGYCFIDFQCSFPYLWHITHYIGCKEKYFFKLKIKFQYQFWRIQLQKYQQQNLGNRLYYC